MFNTVVVGVDGRQGGRDALALARRLAAREIIALAAYPYEYFVSRGANADFEALMRAEVGRTLDAELRAGDVKATPVVVGDGSPARALHRAAERQNADLIVVGSSHRGRAGRVFAGDVSLSTMHGARCPVLVAPAGYAGADRPIARIGVAYDGKPESRDALEAACALAESLDADVHVLTVLQPAWPLTAYPSSMHDWSERAESTRQAEAAALDELVAELGPRASGELLEGEPARELGYAGYDVDLLVCGSRSYGPVRRLILGSTSARLIREARCPVLVLPRSAESEAELPDAEAAAQAS